MPQSRAASPSGASASSQRAGVLQAIGAYGIWGVLPAYFLILAPAGPFEIVAWRVLFSLVFCAVIITATRRWEQLFSIVRQRRLMLSMAAAAALIFLNWQVYVIATLNGQVIEAALGYFINPIVTVLLGVILLRERLRAAQWTAVGISAVAVLVLAINYGVFPWISLTLAVSFGLYGLMKKNVGPRVDAVSGLTIETGMLVPLAIAQVIWVGATTGVVLGNAGGVNTILLLLAGVVTAIPLLLFAAAARRLPLVYMGLIQYLTPVLQFMFGAFVMHEAMPTSRWIGFGLVWLALIILSVDMMAHGRAVRRALPPPA